MNSHVEGQQSGTMTMINPNFIHYKPRSRVIMQNKLRLQCTFIYEKSKIKIVRKSTHVEIYLYKNQKTLRNGSSFWQSPSIYDEQPI